MKWSQRERQRRSAPSPTHSPGLPGTRLILRKSVRLDLRWGGLALPTGCRSGLQPGGRFPIARDQPSERARGRLGLRRRRVAADSRMIFGLEFRRAELGAKADARPLAYADIPNSPAVAGRLAVQVERPRAWHCLNQRTISLAGSRVVASLVDDAIRMTISSRPRCGFRPRPRPLALPRGSPAQHRLA